MDSIDSSLGQPAGSASPQPAAPQAARPAARRQSRGNLFATVLVIGVTAACMLGFQLLLLRKNPDPGIRVWMLNHTPDQVAIINPFNGVIEKKFQVADGLRELAFSRDYSKAFIANVVDVSNRISVLDTRTYLREETIEVDGVPQGFGVFPDNRRLACVLGSKTDFMAGGFDVLDLDTWSEGNRERKKRLWRARELQLTHKIAVGDDGDRIYLIDAKEPLINIYSFSRKERIGQIDLHGAPEELLYPPAGKYYYVSVLVHNTIYCIDKQTDQIVAAYIYKMPDPTARWENRKRLRYMAVDSRGAYLYATAFEDKAVICWEVDNPTRSVSWEQVPPDPNGRRSIAPVPYYLPQTHIKLKGGYDPNLIFIPGGQQIVLDPSDSYVFVVDDEGALYIYDNREIKQAKEGETIEPRGIVPLDKDVEIRDIKVSRPAVRTGASPPEGAKDARLPGAGGAG
ncbi:YncE family protein [bacterium]|nr:YncE family protein [bacterium]